MIAPTNEILYGPPGTGKPMPRHAGLWNSAVKKRPTTGPS
jgi:ATP-dependent 26S proteasome regulatory subunit